MQRETQSISGSETARCSRLRDSSTGKGRSRERRRGGEEEERSLISNYRGMACSLYRSRADGSALANADAHTAILRTCHLEHNLRFLGLLYCMARRRQCGERYVGEEGKNAGVYGSVARTANSSKSWESRGGLSLQGKLPRHDTLFSFACWRVCLCVSPLGALSAC